MPPKKNITGIKSLIGKNIWAESRYDSNRLEGKLVSTDEDYLGIEVEGRIFYFSKYVIRAISEEVVNVPSS